MPCPQRHVFKSCCVHRSSFNPVMSCRVHGDSSRAGGSSSHGRGGHSQPPAPPVADVEAVAEGPCEGPCCHVMPRRSLSFRASPTEGFLLLWSVLFQCGLSCSCLSSPGGLLIPPNYPREILGGG